MVSGNGKLGIWFQVWHSAERFGKHAWTCACVVLSWRWLGRLLRDGGWVGRSQHQKTLRRGDAGGKRSGGNGWRKCKGRAIPWSSISYPSCSIATLSWWTLFSLAWNCSIPSALASSRPPPTQPPTCQTSRLPSFISSPNRSPRSAKAFLNFTPRILLPLLPLRQSRNQGFGRQLLTCDINSVHFENCAKKSSKGSSVSASPWPRNGARRYGVTRWMAVWRTTGTRATPLLPW